MLTFSLGGNQFISCKDVLIAICLIWNVVHRHSMADHNLFACQQKCKQSSLPTALSKTLFYLIHFKLLYLILVQIF